MHKTQTYRDTMAPPRSRRVSVCVCVLARVRARGRRAMLQMSGRRFGEELDPWDR